MKYHTAQRLTNLTMHPDDISAGLFPSCNGDLGAISASEYKFPCAASVLDHLDALRTLVGLASERPCLGIVAAASAEQLHQPMDTNLDGLGGQARIHQTHETGLTDVAGLAWG